MYVGAACMYCARESTTIQYSLLSPSVHCHNRRDQVHDGESPEFIPDDPVPTEHWATE